jgi:hypothetical protein
VGEVLAFRAELVTDYFAGVCALLVHVLVDACAWGRSSGIGDALCAGVVFYTFVTDLVVADVAVLPISTAKAAVHVAGSAGCFGVSRWISVPFAFD